MASGLDFKDAASAARRLGLSAQEMIELLEHGDLPGIQLGERWLVSEQALDEFLRSEQERQFGWRRANQVRPRVQAARRTRSGRSNSKLEFLLLGEKHVVSTRIEVLVSVLQTLASRDRHFLDKFRNESGRSRRYVANSPEDLYPGRPHLSHFSKELAPGWWVGTNYNARDIESILKKACRVAGLRWGEDLILLKRGQTNRARAIAFVGVAEDSAGDVARRHDEYFAESLTRGQP